MLHFEVISFEPIEITTYNKLHFPRHDFFPVFYGFTQKRDTFPLYILRSMCNIHFIRIIVTNTTEKRIILCKNNKSEA